MTYKKAQEALRAQADPEKAAFAQRFFKTGEGEYGEGDKFLGLRVPVLRKLAKEYRQMPLPEIQKLLESVFHEERLFACFLLVGRFAKAGEDTRSQIYSFYLQNTRYINNWDLVDSSAYQVVGGYLFDKDREILETLARSESLWERRISIISTLFFIKQGQYTDTLKLANVLLNDPEDLIHKAAGWMLREVGNRDRSVEEEFLDQYYRQMPRTMLRYAIEKFDKEQRQAYLTGAK